jgi:FkbM family methyltransferase
VLARLVKVLLGLVPGPVIDRSRKLPVVATMLRRLLGVVSTPLHGHAVAVDHGPAQGLLLVFDATSAVWVSGRTELPVQRALERLVERGSVFFDIGANVGFFTLLGARLVGPSGRVVAFEPHPENVEKLRRNVELNSFSNVEIVACAVSDLTGHGMLDARHAATAVLLSPSNADSDEALARVETMSLDDFLAARPELDPGVVKIDAEGHEVEIVRGMLETLRRTPIVLVCEMHRRDREFAQAVEAAGYCMVALDGTPHPAGSASFAHVLAAPQGDRAFTAARPA